MVTVYTLPNCSKCNLTKDLLDSEGIEYDVVDLSEDDLARNYVRDWLGYSQAPVVETADDTWSGFDKQKILDIER